MKLFLHIGTQKTGSTAIQAMLYANRALLKHAGWHVMCDRGTANYRKLVAACMDFDRPDDHLQRNEIDGDAARGAFRDEVFAGFHAELAGLKQGVKGVVISGEHFSSNLVRPAELARLHGLFAPYFSDIRILCYLRDQVSLRAASYSTSLKSGHRSVFGDPVKVCDPNLPFFNYALLLDNWAEIFGASALDVRLFDPTQWQGGDLLEDVVATLAPEILGRFTRDSQPNNPSLNHHGQLLMRAINEVVPTEHARPSHVRYSLIRMCESLFAGKGQYPTAAEQATIYEAFRASNARVAQTYLGQSGDLFPPPSYDEGLMPLEPDFISAIAKLLSALVQPDVLILPGHYADLFRDAAKKLEDQDAETAYQLMHLAGIMRPSGHVIQARLKELEGRLDSAAKP